MWQQTRQQVMGKALQTWPTQLTLTPWDTAKAETAINTDTTAA